jgi:hypothetical protein
MEVYVTTCFGVVPIEGARVTVTYEGLPDGKGAQNETHLTDAQGRAEPFTLRAKRVKIRDRFVDFPKNHGCNVSIAADGYVLTSAKNVPIFPDVTVKRSFDLIPKGIKNDA